MGIRYKTFDTPQIVPVQVSPIAMTAIQWMLDCGYDNASAEVREQAALESVTHWVRLWGHYPAPLPGPPAHDPESHAWLEPWATYLRDGTADTWNCFDITLSAATMNVIHEHAFEYSLPDWAMASVVANCRGHFLATTEERNRQHMGKAPVLPPRSPRT